MTDTPDTPKPDLVIVPPPRQRKRRKPSASGVGCGGVPKASRLRPEGLTVELAPEAVVFLHHYLECGFNASEATRRTGLTPARATRIRTSKGFKRALVEVLDGEGISPTRIKVALGAIAFSELDLADLEPYLEGAASLRDLREAGVPTHLLTEAASNPGPHGIARRVKIADKLAALKELVRIQGMATERREVNATVRVADAIRDDGTPEAYAARLAALDEGA